MLEDGEELDGDLLPVVEIEAADEREAAEKLLLINSRYAKISQSGFDEFIAKFRVNMEKFQSMIEIPEIDLTVPDFDPGTEDDQGNLDKLDPKIVECPHCGQEFDLREQE